MILNRRAFVLGQMASFALAPLLGAGAARAQQSVPIFAVVELFTSQACSSCPPADVYLAELIKRPGIVAIAYHVDYWDYIGWKDTFGRSENSQLQRDYARARKQVQIYTPQMVVNGTAGMVGSNRPAVEATLKKARLPVAVELRAKNGYVSISAEADAALPESAVFLVPYRRHAEVAIAKGENKGRKLDYDNIVLGRQVLGMWEPAKGASIRLPLSEILVDGADSLAVIVQQDNNGLPGPILGGATLTP